MVSVKAVNQKNRTILFLFEASFLILRLIKDLVDDLNDKETDLQSK